jgi:hypothetical protein
MTLVGASRLFTSQKVHTRSDGEQKASALKDQTSQWRATDPEYTISNAHRDVVRLIWEITWMSKLNRVPVHSDYRRGPHPALDTSAAHSAPRSLKKHSTLFFQWLEICFTIVVQHAVLYFLQVIYPRCVEYKLKYRAFDNVLRDYKNLL